MPQVQTAESVSAGHPDKICDQISDAIVDACLMQDPKSKIAVEALAGHGHAVLLGELTTTAIISPEEITHKILSEFGYKQYEVDSYIVTQSPEISAHVSQGGAGDQGIMVGYACDETPELLPKEFALARRLTQLMGLIDGKSQVTLQDGKITRLVTSVGGAYPPELLKAIHDLGLTEGDDRWIKNQYETAGLDSDAGLTGRKIVVDAYGPRVPVGGGAFSGKDPSKVDRSAAYMARKVAVDLLKKKHAKEVTVKLAYSIGLSKELMATAEIVTRDGVRVFVDYIEGYDFSPLKIATLLNLYTPIYFYTARFGHFGMNRAWDV